MKATHKIIEGKSREQIIRMAFTAMKNINDCEQGTVLNPVNLASCVCDDGRTIAKTIKEDGYIRFNDGWYIVEVDDYTIYVDVTAFALKEMGNPKYEIIDAVNV